MDENIFAMIKEKKIFFIKTSDCLRIHCGKGLFFVHRRDITFIPFKENIFKDTCTNCFGSSFICYNISGILVWLLRNSDLNQIDILWINLAKRSRNDGRFFSSASEFRCMVEDELTKNNPE